MKPVSTYDNYRVLLHDLIDEKKKGRAGLSKRSIAALASLSPSYLSRVLSGHRGLSIECATRLSSVFGLSAEESLYLYDLIALEAAKNPKEKARVLKRISLSNSAIHFLEADSFRMIADWYHFAILALLSSKGFRANAKWISRRLGIQTFEAKGGFDRLIKLGLIGRKGKDFYAKESGNFQTSHDVASEAVRENHKQNLSRAQHAIDELEPSLREFLNRTLCMSVSDIPEAKKRLRNFIDRFNRDFDKPGAEDIYQINLQFYRVTRPVTESLS